MTTAPAWFMRRKTLLLAAVTAVAAGAAATWWLLQPTVLTVAVAPRDGTEPELIKAYAEALEAGREGVRLRILSFDDVRQSAAALEDGRVDLAVVRPDVLLPTNGLTLAILRDQAMLVVSPESAGIRTFPKLAGKRLGIAAHREADVSLLASIIGYHGLTLQAADGGGGGAREGVRLVPIDGDAAAAFREKRVDAFVSIIAPSAPRALALVEAVGSTTRSGKVDFVAVEDDGAIIERFPRLQAVTVPGGLFGGHPKLPTDDVKTVGASYRLMARASLSRVQAADVTQQLFEKRAAAARATSAAEYVQAPAYDTTAAATSARIPIHPGAIDYYEREQHGLVERYGDTLYLLGALAGGVFSALAWLRQRLRTLRGERIDEVIDRLIEIAGRARTVRDAAAVAAFEAEVDGLAADAVRDARAREPEAPVLTALSIAIDTAKAALAARGRAVSVVGPGTATPAVEATAGTGTHAAS